MVHNGGVAKDNDVRSVRIELDDGVLADGLEIPEIESQPSGGSKLPILFGLAVIITLGLLLLGLSPDEDQAADGTLRETPATTIPSTTNPDAEVGESVEESDEPLEVPDLVLPDARAGIAIATLIEDQEFVSSIVSTDDGLLGLRGPSASDPTLVASANGFEWVEVEVSVENPAGVDLTSFLVVELSKVPEEAGGGFSMLAFDFSISQRSGEQFRTAILTSPDGATWEVLDTTEPQAQGSVPRLLSGGSVIATIDEGRPIDALISEHTDLIIAGEPICSETRQVDTEDPRVWLLLCDGTGAVLLGADDIITDADPSAVLDCALALSPEESGTGIGVRFFDLDGGLSGVFGSGESAFFLGPDPFPDLLSLDEGGVAFYDVGSSSGSVCDGVTNPGDDREPSVVVIDTNIGRAQPFALPIEGTTVRLVGETQRFADDSKYVLVEIDASLWGLNPESGSWAILTSNQGNTISEFFAVSESGGRAYQLVESTLRVIDFDIRPGGSGLFAIREEFPLERIIAERIPEVSDALLRTEDVVFAGETQLIVTNDAGQLWLIDTPSIPADAQGARSEDFGGVGLAR